MTKNDHSTTNSSAASADTSGENDALRAQLLEEMNPKRTWLNRFCKSLNYFTIVVASVIAVLEVVGFFYLEMTLLENILCFYLILFCILIIVTINQSFQLEK
eukprot:CAMPEP_0178733254 /NCGR_PEP_ID=MMETSP0744-20121128/694_1 /TAXON_ID=913974 /ORGANISM="Nitzschia punctata, Strain CCMP561" /LENGTH=101 /DNA_ID=CAMNT_0020385419 /DNA_START=10 /DNA_END=315 /DNA_ORIENTATION=-